MISRKLPRVLGLAARMLGDRSEAEDVAQEVFLRIWRQSPDWEAGNARFDTWLHRVGAQSLP
ncbi:sigma factor [Mesorhizobium sp. M1217]|uniref:sigma factor n=1 Tax=Mesorhizobium sp. M1217 TaxID=2957070 RepID=UPI003338197F